MFRKKPAVEIPSTWMIVGLGNPGGEYQRTRHNVGFDLIDVIADKYKVKISKAKHNARFGTAVIENEGVLLVKPLTFMNKSGQSVAPLAREHSLKPDRILVVADDLDLDLGRTRLRAKGSAGGHNGHKSLITNLGTDEYPRIKIGIGSVDRDETIDHVLSKFNPEERKSIDDAIDRAIRGIEILLGQGMDPALQFLNPAGS